MFGGGTGTMLRYAANDAGTGGAEGASWVDVGSLDNYGASGADPLTILIDGNDNHLLV